MVKTIKVIRLAPGESALITAAPGPNPPCLAAAGCPYIGEEQKHSCVTRPPRQPDQIVALFHVA